MRKFYLFLLLSLLMASTAVTQPRVTFKVLIEDVSQAYQFTASGFFNTPVGAMAPGPIGPGGAYEFQFSAVPGARLSFATMFVPSNDLFYSPDENGIALFDANGAPVSGEVTSQIQLWDAGTEANEEPGVGPHQVQRQPGPNTGPADPNKQVRLVNDGFIYPAITDVIRVTINSTPERRFTVRLENVSTNTTLKPSNGTMQPVPLSPGVWVVHTQPGPLFTSGQPDRGHGLEAIAEDGNPGGLATALANETGLTVPLSPGVWAVHGTPAPLFTSGQPDRGAGLEAIAEDGNPMALGMALATQMGIISSGVFNTPVDATSPGPIGPGRAYAFMVSATPGARLSFATMFVPSNDLIYAPDENGIALFDANGQPISGNVTNQLMLWDVGTEINQEPGIGPDQVQRQSGPNTGAPDPDMRVRLVNDGYTYPKVAEVIRVTIKPVETIPFRVLVENVSTPTTLKPSNGTMQPVPLSPGVWAVHTEDAPLFKSGEPDRGQGLEAIAEDGTPAMLGMVLANRPGVVSSGVIDTPVGASAPAPIGPDGGYEFVANAIPGSRLSFATMFVPSNDLFYAPDEKGIALFREDGAPIFGNFTTQVTLWDAGTEANEEPGVGPNQVQRQPAPNTGPPDPNNLVRLVNDGFIYPAVSQVIRVTITPLIHFPFKVRIENVSTPTTLQPTNGTMQPVPLSPGAWAVHTTPAPIFTPGQPDRGQGLETIAEDGNAAMLGAALGNRLGVAVSGVFDTPAGASVPGPIGPGGAYEFFFQATPGAQLSFATMFVPSNDLFYAPDENGIALFNAEGMPVSGEVTVQITLWDAGTEANEEPGVGPNQVQRQPAPNTGPPDPNNLVRLVNDGFIYPAVAQVIRVTINRVEPTPFTVRIENVSTPTTLKPSNGTMQPVPLSPGAWAVHTTPAPIFTTGQPDRGEGLEAIAEDGNAAMLAAALARQPGILASNAFNTPAGASAPAPIGPGGAYQFSFVAAPGARLSLATMFVPSNDLFYAPDENGIALFNADGMPVSGEVTMQFQLWDAGTEANEEPGVGPNQVQRQPAPNTGPADPNKLVRLVNDGFTYPEVAQVLRVIINPVQPTPFTVRIENVSTPTTLKPSDGSMQPVPLSPGAWAVHTIPAPIFNSGQPDRGCGLEGIAEDGHADMLASTLARQAGILVSGLFNTPVGAATPGPIGPGGAYEFSFEAAPGALLSLATMFVPSNDLFYSPDEKGIALFNAAGAPVTGEATAQIMLWDAGTEMNQEPGVGPHQVQRQSAPNTGAADPNNLVRLVNDGFVYPPVAQVIRITINAGTTSVNQNSQSAPITFRLEQNYPNPFNPETTIKYAITRPGKVKLTIYNLLGHKVVDLVDEFQTAGEYNLHWDGKNSRGSSVATGVYIYRLEIEGESRVRKMTMLK